MARAPRKRGGKAKKRGLSEEQIPVLICRDRTGRTTDGVMKKVNAKTISAVLKPLLEKDTMLCADGNPAYVKVAHDMDVPLRAINVSAGIRVIDKIFHVQNVNAYDSRLQTWMRRFNGVATKHLPNYLGWRRMLERLHNAPTPQVILLSALGRVQLQ